MLELVFLQLAVSWVKSNVCRHCVNFNFIPCILSDVNHIPDHSAWSLTVHYVFCILLLYGIVAILACLPNMASIHLLYSGALRLSMCCRCILEQRSVQVGMVPCCLKGIIGMKNYLTHGTSHMPTNSGHGTASFALVTKKYQREHQRECLTILRFAVYIKGRGLCLWMIPAYLLPCWKMALPCTQRMLGNSAIQQTN